MSIFNSVAALIASGGVEYEEGTFQGDDSITKSVYFSNTHTTAPDLVLCYYTYNGGASSALANIEYINPQGFLEGYFGSGSPYRLSLRNDGTASTQTAVNELTSTYFKLYIVPTLSHYNTYVWYAFWFNGSGSGGGGSSGGGSSGGGEMEHGTFTGDGGAEHIATFTDTHTAPPDIVTCSIDDLSQPVNSCDLVCSAIYFGNDNFPAPYEPNHTYNLDESVFYSIYYVKPNYSPNYYGGILDEQFLPETYTNTFVSIPAYMGFKSGLTYTWKAIWLNGSGGGGGGGTVNLQAKTHIGASTSSQTISADAGYDGLSSVQIDPVSQTNLLASNIKSGTTVSISNGTSNLWNVTGTYSGGSSKNVQVHQSTSRTSSTSLTSVNSLTCSTAGTYDVYWSCNRSSTSGTWSSQLYIGGATYGSEQTTWTNHVQTVHLSNVSISANQTVAVYVKARGTNYYGYCPQLTIVQS